MIIIQKRLTTIVLISLIGTIVVILFNITSNKPNTTKNHINKINNNGLVKIFDRFFNQSSEQQLIPKEIIFKTMKYMMEERDEYDPELVAFVRSLIIRPHKSKKLNLSKNGISDYSQTGHSIYIDKLLGEKKNGFFIESGAYNGELFSNSLFFELNRNWTGILIEPIPSYFKELLSKNRQVYILNACIANKHPIVARFRVSDVLSGRLSELAKGHEYRMDKEVGTGKFYVNVPCFSLNTILKAIDVDKVDYFSLDVEGGEFSALQGLDFKNIDITSLSIEYNGFEDAKNKIQSLMSINGYNLTADDRQDLFYLKN
jgi:FkbM family methyltransferase